LRAHKHNSANYRKAIEFRQQENFLANFNPFYGTLEASAESAQRGDKEAKERTINRRRATFGAQRKMEKRKTRQMSPLK
jgi:hypothetical protein